MKRPQIEPLAGEPGRPYEYLYLQPLAPVPVGPPETGVEEPRPHQTAAE